MWLVLFVVSTLYACVWDIYMDWGLGRRNCRYYLLRKDLLYMPHVWVRRALLPLPYPKASYKITTSLSSVLL